MDVFLEKQFIKRWWLFMFILAVIVIGVGTAYYATENAEEDTAVVVSLISLIVTLPIVISLLLLRMETRIDDKGVLAYFRPFGFTKKYFPREEIKEIYVRGYDPTTEFGGWGMRGVGQEDKSYNVGGNSGIQIITKDDKKFLIGTHKPKEAEAFLKRYQNIQPINEK